MKKVWTTVFLLFGTIVGSGFSSGKEILVFFSRFGELSYLYIVIACVLFFLLFYLSGGKQHTIRNAYSIGRLCGHAQVFAYLDMCVRIWS